MFQKIHKLTEREYRALIGLNKKDFRALTVLFSESEQELKNQAYEDFVEKYDRKPTAGGSPKFKTPSEKLFFTLYYLTGLLTFSELKSINFENTELLPTFRNHNKLKCHGGTVLQINITNRNSK